MTDLELSGPSNIFTYLFTRETPSGHVGAWT